MKVIFSMRSSFAFNRTKTIFENDPTFESIQFYDENIESVNDLKDIIEIIEPELYVIDKSNPNWEEYFHLVNQIGLDYLYFEGDYDTLKSDIISFFNLEEKEVESSRKKINYLEAEEPKEKIIYRDRIVEKEIIRTEYTSIPNTQIAFISLWQGAGTTTLVLNLARGLAERGLSVGVVENPLLKPYIFDYLQIIRHEHLNPNFTYVDLAQRIKENNSFKFKEKPFKYAGIDWYVNDSRLQPIKEFTTDQFLRVLLSINSTFQLIDLSHEITEKHTQDLLKSVDHVFVVLEPDPIKLDWLSELRKDGIPLQEQRQEHKLLKFLDELEENGISYDFILNKYVSKGEMKDFITHLPKKPITQIPVLDYTDLNECVWKSTFIYDQQKGELDKQFIPIYSKFVPKDYIKLPKENKKNLMDTFKRLKEKVRGEKEDEKSN